MPSCAGAIGGRAAHLKAPGDKTIDRRQDMVAKFVSHDKARDQKTMRTCATSFFAKMVLVV